MRFILAITLCCAPVIAAAQIYRWVDPGGQVHFSQSPPVSGPYKNVTPPASTIAPSSKSRGQTLVGSADDHQDLRLKADNAERCAKARERVSFLEEKTARRLYKTGDDGKPSPLTQEEFDQQLSDAKAAGSKYCG